MKALVLAVWSVVLSALPVAAQDWATWWELNSPRYLQLRGAVRDVQIPEDAWSLHPVRRSDHLTLNPTDEQLEKAVVPGLHAALDDAADEDLVSSCLMALAKIGIDPNDTTLIAVIAGHLDSKSREVRHSAVLALGIAGRRHPQADAVLLRILADPHTADLHSFAAHALAVALHDVGEPPRRRRALVALRQVLELRDSDTDLRVAAVSAIGLLGLPGDSLQPVTAVFEEAEDPLVRAHCVTAIARLLHPDHPDAERFRARFARGLEGDGGDRDPRVRQSCVLALGQLCRPVTTGEDRYGQALLEAHTTDKDGPTRQFAILALGQIGGLRHRALLLELFQRSRNSDRVWCALALGVHSFHEYERQMAANGYVEPDEEIGEALAAAFEADKWPSLLAAEAIAMGLNQHTDAAAPIRDKLLASIAMEDLAGHLCTGLALMSDSPSTEDLRDIVAKSQRRPDLFVEASVALGLLGDKRIADDLAKLATSEFPLTTTRFATVMLALSHVGDTRSLDPLLAMLAEGERPAIERAFAAVALGGICAQDDLPWNAALGANLNFHAATPSLCDREFGVLTRF